LGLNPSATPDRKNYRGSDVTYSLENRDPGAARGPEKFGDDLRSVEEPNATVRRWESL